MTEKWSYGVVDAYTDEYATEMEFSAFADAVAWAKERDLDPEQFAVLMYDGTETRLLAIA
jgi:hypothetical protein